MGGNSHRSLWEIILMGIQGSKLPWEAMGGIFHGNTWDFHGVGLPGCALLDVVLPCCYRQL